MSGKKLDWRHGLAAILITVLLCALWKRTATGANDITKIQVSAGANAMTQDPNSP